jgi:DinB superfamily
VKANLMQLSEYTWRRTRARLDGLTDEEYLWEPVPAGWTIRPGHDGLLHPDWQFPIDPPPFTTIAWRICHLIRCYGEIRNREWLGLRLEGDRDRFGPSAPAPARASKALTILEAAYSEWAAVLRLVSEADLHDKLGPVAGPFADADKAGFVLHMMDEFIHHGAEVALLRDLWRARSGSPGPQGSARLQAVIGPGDDGC